MQPNKHTFYWTSDASGNATVVSAVPISGEIQRVVIVPSTSAAPTDQYDLTLADSDGIDVLAGQGSNLSDSASKNVLPGVPLKDGTTTKTAPVIVDGFLTLTVTNAGDTKSGRIAVYADGAVGNTTSGSAPVVSTVPAPVIASATTQTTTTPTANLSVVTGYDAVRVWINETTSSESHFFLYVNRGTTVTKIKMYRFTSRVIRLDGSGTVGFGTADGRTIQWASDTVRASLPTSFAATGTALCDQAGPPLWTPTSAHITLTSGKCFEIASTGTELIVFVSEYDGTTWSAPRWFRLPTSGGLRIHTTFNQIALANYAGTSLTINAATGATIGGTSAVMHLTMPTVSGTAWNCSTLAEFKAAMAAAVSGDEIVLADGTYALDINVNAATFAANNGFSGKIGAEGILIRSSSDTRESCVITCASAAVGNWSLTQTGATLRSGIRGIKFDFTAGTSSTSTFTISLGKWSIENCRFTGAQGTSDCFLFNGSATTVGLDLDCLRVTADTSANDCYNGTLGGGTGTNSVRFIDCVGHTPGAASNAQCMTTHGSLPVSLYGGSYYNAFLNVFASDADTSPIYAFFTTTSAGVRTCGVANTVAFGSSFGITSDVTTFLSVTNYMAATRFANQVREASNLARVLEGNVHSASGTATAIAAYYPNVTTSTVFDFNIVSNVQTGLRLDNGSGTIACRHNTVVSTTTAIAEAAGTSSVTLKGNITKTASSKAFNITATQMALLTTSYNTYGSPVDADLVPGSNDLNGTDAQLDTLYFPTAAGNCDGNGDPAVTDYVGGTDAWGYPLRIASSVMDRGARFRPRLVSASELIQDVW